MLIFLCSYALLHTVEAAICDWASSSQGSAFYQQTLQGFREKETMQQTSLRVLALLSFERILRSRTDETSGPLHGCYLDDFRRHLDGETLRNRRVLLEKMALSLKRVLCERVSAAISRFFDMVGAERALHPLDGTSDRYWEYRIYREQGHEDAWQMAWKQVEEAISRCDAGGGGQEHQGGDEGQGKDDLGLSKGEWCLVD